MQMILYFFNKFNISLEEDFKMTKIHYDTIDSFGNLYKLCSEFYHNEDRELIKEIFVKFIDLGHQLGFSDNDIIESCLRKIRKNFKRFEEGF